MEAIPSRDTLMRLVYLQEKLIHLLGADLVTCSRCLIEVPRKWAFVEEGDDYECPACWHRCEEREMREKIQHMQKVIRQLQAELAANYERSGVGETVVLPVIV